MYNPKLFKNPKTNELFNVSLPFKIFEKDGVVEYSYAHKVIILHEPFMSMLALARGEDPYKYGTFEHLISIDNLGRVNYKEFVLNLVEMEGSSGSGYKEKNNPE